MKGQMPVKMPTASATEKKPAPTTFEERKALAKPGDLFLAPDLKAAWLVVSLADGSRGVMAIPMDGSPQSWTARGIEMIHLADDWTLHPVEHINLTYLAERS